MKVLVCVFIALFAVSSLQQASPVRSFLTGLVNGANFQANTTVIGLMTEDLDLAKITSALRKIASKHHIPTIVGLEQLHNALFAYAGKTYKTIDLDAGLKTAYNFTLTLLGNKKDFFTRAKRSVAESKIDVFPALIHAANAAKSRSFYNVGTNLGWAIIQLVRSGPALPLPHAGAQQQQQQQQKKST
eukprot:TRINITY_DN6721_c0_g1_i3.p1 TRINITY_DN6721_c0_g1~~TRINITY_DN6721_c0_g1_i3.p1  ORF type:complete len:187 (-),score=45.23 TRINITY_DN6721_c0_g1_i3:81-641(-)